MTSQKILPWIRTIFCLVMFLAVITQAHASEPRCEEESTNQELSECLTKGHRFLNKYLKHIQGKGSRRARKKFDMCRTFNNTFQACMDPLIERCPAVHQQMHSHWKTLYDVMSCACNKNEECVTSVQCFETHYYGILGQGCDQYFKFNMRQRTHPPCHFLKERLNCKVALVSSACDSRATSLAHHLHMLQHKDKHTKHGCKLTWDGRHNKFQYTDKCTATRLMSVADCVKELDQNYLYFDQLNDLVSEGGRKAVKKACRDFKSYMTCMQPIQEDCPRGTKLLYELDSDIRRYSLKMDYICNEEQAEYLEHLNCYQDVMANKTLSQCDHIWDVARPLLDSVSSYQFYCQEDLENSSRLRGSLDDLRLCYEDVFRVGCNSKGGDVMGELMRRAFRDPFYLTFDFVPNCTQHSSHSHTLSTEKSGVVRPTVVGKRDKHGQEVQVQETKPKQGASRTLNSSSSNTLSVHLVLFLVFSLILR